MRRIVVLWIIVSISAQVIFKVDCDMPTGTGPVALKKSHHVNGGPENFIFGEGITSYGVGSAERTGYVIKLPPLVFLKTHKTGSSTVTSIVQRLADIRDLNVMVPGEL